MKKTWILGLSALAVGLGAVPASAQPVISAKSGTVAYVLGQVFLDDKAIEIQQGSQFPDMKEKSVLRTTEGRAEVLLPPGIVMRVGENTSFQMISNRLIDTRLELLTGSAIIEADEIAKDTSVTVVSKNATVTFTKAGIYRFDAEPARLKVFKGVASIQMGGQTLAISEGKMAGLAGESATAEKFDVNSTDSLDNWSRKRGEQMAMANISAAKRAHNTPWITAGNPCMNYYNMGSHVAQQGGGWGYNPWYGMITYIPCNGSFMSPYGYRYWSPNTVSRVYYQPPPPTYNNGGGGFGGFSPSYPTAGTTSSGYSGTVASAPSTMSSSAPSSSGSTTAAAASSGGGASHGGGAAASGGAAGGGHGH